MNIESFGQFSKIMCSSFNGVMGNEFGFELKAPSIIIMFLDGNEHHDWCLLA